MATASRLQERPTSGRHGTVNSRFSGPAALPSTSPLQTGCKGSGRKNKWARSAGSQPPPLHGQAGSSEVELRSFPGAAPRRRERGWNPSRPNPPQSWGPATPAPPPRDWPARGTRILRWKWRSSAQLQCWTWAFRAIHLALIPSRAWLIICLLSVLGCAELAGVGPDTQARRERRSSALDYVLQMGMENLFARLLQERMKSLLLPVGPTL